MKKTASKDVAALDPLSEVATLVPHDDPRLDPAPMARLFTEKGEVAAELVIGRAMDELAERVARAEALHHACKFAELARISRSIVGVAQGIGFQGVANAAVQVSVCAMTRDPVALSSTLARLMRLTEQSLTAVWDFETNAPEFDPGG